MMCFISCFGDPCVPVKDVVAPPRDVGVPCQPSAWVHGDEWKGTIVGCAAEEATVPAWISKMLHTSSTTTTTTTRTQTVKTNMQETTTSRTQRRGEVLLGWVGTLRF